MRLFSIAIAFLLGVSTGFLISFGPLKQLYVRDKVGRIGYIASPDGMEKYRCLVFSDSRFQGVQMDDTSTKIFAYGGCTSAQIDHIIRRQVPHRITDKILVQVGVNDLVAAALKEGDPDEIQRGLIQNLNSIYEHALKNGIYCIFTYIIPPAKPSIVTRLLRRNDLLGLVLETNAQLAKTANEKGWRVAEIRLPKDEEGYIADEISRDELHLNAKGFQFVSESIRTILEDEGAI